MATETLKEFQKMAPDELTKREEELRLELFKLRTETATDKGKDTSRAGKLRKDIARILTIRTQAEKTKQASKAKA